MTLCIVPARGGSKGIPNKNIKPLQGRPLLAHAIECALAAKSIQHIAVSSDDQEILAVAQGFPTVEIIRRPAELATDTAAMLPVLEHALLQSEKTRGCRFERIVLLDPTAPLRIPKDIEGALAVFDSAQWDLVASAHLSHRNPYFNMVKLDQDQRASLVIETSPPITRRQDAPPTFDLNTCVWVFSRKCILELKTRMPQKTTIYEIPSDRAIDLDTMEDFRYLEFKLGKR